MSRTINWRGLVQDVSHQKILVSLILVTVEGVIRQLEQNALISRAEMVRLSQQLRNYSEKDLTHVQDVFYLEVHPNQSITSQINSMKLQALLNVLNKKGAFSGSKKLEFFTWRFRELISLHQVLKGARNAAAHDFSERPEIGWSLSIFSAYLRLLEVAVIPLKYEDKIEEIKNELASGIISTLGKDKEHSFEKDTEEAGDKKVEHTKQINSEIPLQTIENAIQEIGSKLNDIESKIDWQNNLKANYQHKSEETSLETKISNKSIEKDEIEEQETFEKPQDFITEGVLKQHLIAIKNEIELEYSKHGNWPGVSANILQKSILSILFTERITRIELAISRSEFSWRYKKYKSFMDEQVQQFGARVNHAISKVIWDD